jgi:hypothetical protein
MAYSLYAQEGAVEKRESNSDSVLKVQKLQHFIFCDLAGLTLLDIAVAYEAVLHSQFYARIGHNVGLLNIFFPPRSSNNEYISLIPLGIGYIFPSKSSWSAEVGLGSNLFVDWLNLFSQNRSIYPSIGFSSIPIALIGGARFYPEESIWAFRFYGTINYLSTKNFIPWFGISDGIRL